MCSTEGCHICVCMTSTFWLVLVTAAWILSIQGWVEPHSSSVSAAFWFFVSLQAVFFFLWCWLIFVSGCAFICSLILHGVTSFWERGLDFVSDRFQLGKTYLGAVAMAGPGSILRLGLRYMHIGWSSIRHWLLVGWLLVIDQWSLIGYWLLIIHWLLICLLSTYCPSLTVIHQPHNHAQTHNTHLVKANKACKFIQIQ